MSYLTPEEGRIMSVSVARTAVGIVDRKIEAELNRIVDELNNLDEQRKELEYQKAQLLDARSELRYALDDLSNVEDIFNEIYG